MKYRVKQFRDLKVALKEFERFIRDPNYLWTGRPMKRFGGMRPRELVANWLICAAFNSRYEDKDRLTFTSDPVDGDGIFYDKITEETWPSEHVFIPPARKPEFVDLEALILKAIERKQRNGGAAYASGKTLVVFADAGGGAAWSPNKIARRLRGTLDFAVVWAVALCRAEAGEYTYAVTQLDLDEGNAPTMLVRIGADFDTWEVEQIQ
jgi:hypothetical protein